MIRRLFRTAAALLLMSAASLFIAGFVAIGFGSFLLTWPVVHGSPTRRRVKSGINLAASTVDFMSTMPTKDDVLRIMKMARAAGVGTDDTPDENVTNV